MQSPDEHEEPRGEWTYVPAVASVHWEGLQSDSSDAALPPTIGSDRIGRIGTLTVPFAALHCAASCCIDRPTRIALHYLQQIHSTG